MIKFFLILLISLSCLVFGKPAIERGESNMILYQTRPDEIKESTKGNQPPKDEVKPTGILETPETSGPFNKRVEDLTEDSEKQYHSEFVSEPYENLAQTGFNNLTEDNGGDDHENEEGYDADKSEDDNGGEDENSDGSDDYGIVEEDHKGHQNEDNDGDENSDNNRDDNSGNNGDNNGDKEAENEAVNEVRDEEENEISVRDDSKNADGDDNANESGHNRRYKNKDLTNKLEVLNSVITAVRIIPEVLNSKVVQNNFVPNFVAKTVKQRKKVKRGRCNKDECKTNCKVYVKIISKRRCPQKPYRKAKETGEESKKDGGDKRNVTSRSANFKTAKGLNDHLKKTLPQILQESKRPGNRNESKTK